MHNFLLGEQFWIINIEPEDVFYLLAKQTITGFMEEENKVECEDDFNTFHVDYADIYKSKSEALEAMISKLNAMR